MAQRKTNSYTHIEPIQNKWIEPFPKSEHKNTKTQTSINDTTVSPDSGPFFFFLLTFCFFFSTWQTHIFAAKVRYSTNVDTLGLGSRILHRRGNMAWLASVCLPLVGDLLVRILIWNHGQKNMVQQKTQTYWLFRDVCLCSCFFFGDSLMTGHFLVVWG